MAVRLVLEDDEVQYLLDIVNFWAEGHEAATTDLQLDRIFEEPEQMLKALASMHKQFSDTVTLQQKLSRALAGLST